MAEQNTAQPESINWNEVPEEELAEVARQRKQHKLQLAGEGIEAICEYYGVQLTAQVSLTADGRITATVHLVPA